VIIAGGKQEDPVTNNFGTKTGSIDPADVDVFSSEYMNPIVVTETEVSIVVLDADGYEVTLTKNPERVIVNYTSMLGLWYLAGGTAVGRPTARSFQGVPEEARTIETTGHVANPNLEKIISLEPDLVVLSGTMDIQRRIKEVLDQNSIENILLSYEHYHDFVNILDLFVRMVGKESIVETLVPGIQEEVTRISSSYSERPTPRFLSLFASTRDVLVELNDSHTAHMAAMLGGANVAEPANIRPGQKRINLSLERVVESRPDVILVTVMGNVSEIQDKMREELMSNQAWNGIRAVREGRVHYLPDHYFLYKPNERFPEAFEYLAKLLYSQDGK
jgi:iron complex transport system substrate-binding protein